MTSDESLHLISASADVELGEVYPFDRKARSLTLQYMLRMQLPEASQATKKSINYASSDGLEIPA